VTDGVRIREERFYLKLRHHEKNLKISVSEIIILNYENY